MDIFKQVEGAPLVTVTGVVQPPGPGAGSVGGAKDWVLRFTLDAWRIENTSVETGPLEVQKRVTQAQLDRFMDQIESEAIVRFTARVLREHPSGKAQAAMDKLISAKAEDEELAAILKKLQEPVTFTDERLGTFTLNRGFRLYDTKVAWNGRPVELSLSAESDEDLPELLHVARELFDAEAEWQRRIEDYAVEELLPLKNDNWLGDREAPLTPAQFRAKMKLKTISVYPDGAFEFWHDDGDMFQGHAILISGDLDEGPNEADIPG